MRLAIPMEENAAWVTRLLPTSLRRRVMRGEHEWAPSDRKRSLSRTLSNARRGLGLPSSSRLS